MGRHPRDLSEPASEAGETVRSIVRAEVSAESSRHQNQCVNDGPICGVREEMAAMRADIEGIKMEFAEARGAHKQQSRNMAIIAVVAGALSAASAIFNVVWRALHG